MTCQIPEAHRKSARTLEWLLKSTSEPKARLEKVGQPLRTYPCLAKAVIVRPQRSCTRSTSVGSTLSPPLANIA